jgi:hypothetical protein
LKKKRIQERKSSEKTYWCGEQKTNNTFSWKSPYNTATGHVAFFPWGEKHTWFQPSCHLYRTSTIRYCRTCIALVARAIYIDRHRPCTGWHSTFRIYDTLLAWPLVPRIKPFFVTIYLFIYFWVHTVRSKAAPRFWAQFI